MIDCLIIVEAISNSKESIVYKTVDDVLNYHPGYCDFSYYDAVFESASKVAKEEHSLYVDQSLGFHGYSYLVDPIPENLPVVTCPYTLEGLGLDNVIVTYADQQKDFADIVELWIEIRCDGNHKKIPVQYSESNGLHFDNDFTSFRRFYGALLDATEYKMIELVSAMSGLSPAIV